MTEKFDNQEALKKRLTELEICLSTNDEGLFTVFTESEPLFCYDATTIDEVNTLVADTLRSYAERFYGIAGLGVRTNQVPAEEPNVRVEAVRPVSRLQPIFDEAA